MTNSIRPFLAPLTEKSQEILEQTVTSFWPSRDDCSVTLTAKNKGDAPAFTDIAVIFQEAAQRTACISACLIQEIRPKNLVFCTKVVPSVGEHGAAIHLEFIAKSDLENLKTHFKALIPEGWVLEETGESAATLRHTKEPNQTAQKELLNREMPNVLKKLSLQRDLRIMLSENNDPEFPGEERLGGVVNCPVPWKDALDITRSFNLQPGSAVLAEKLSIPGLSDGPSYITVSPQEIEDWLTDSASQKGVALRKCQSLFARALIQAWEAKPFDTVKFGQLREAAEREPLLNEVLRDTVSIKRV